MISGHNLGEIPRSGKYLRLLSRISAWLLLATAVIMVFSGWGITHTEFIYKATFGLVDRRLANSIHRATDLPAAIFFLSHVLMNGRLALGRRNPYRIWLVNSLLIIVGLALFGLVLYIEYFS